MEIIKDLPEVFEEFAEQRKNSFLAIKKIKDQNIPVIGSYCTYFPQEIAMAMGAASVGLCSMSDETIPVAEQTLPKNLCPLIKASYGFAVTDKCPFFYFSDVVVGETTCDGKKKMYEFMSELRMYLFWSFLINRQRLHFSTGRVRLSVSKNIWRRNLRWRSQRRSFVRQSASAMRDVVL